MDFCLVVIGGDFDVGFLLEKEGNGEREWWCYMSTSSKVLKRTYLLDRILLAVYILELLAMLVRVQTENATIVVPALQVLLVSHIKSRQSTSYMARQSVVLEFRKAQKEKSSDVDRVFTSLQSMLDGCARSR